MSAERPGSSGEHPAPTGAVFLSYASQDSTAVLRLCETLRAAGVEVWFDQNELVGGDAWDAKIRKQIRECALFMPVISAHTQARLEGYFRIEWRLAAQRTHAMAEEKAFLVPVVIDDTRDADAKVPAEFKAVQWTRLRQAYGGPALDDPAVEAFVARVQALLGGGGGVAAAGIRGRTALPSAAAGPVAAGGRQGWLVPVVAGALILVGLALWQPWRRAPDGAPRAPEAAAAFPRHPELKRAMDLINGFESNTEDFSLAEEIAKGVLAQRATDPEAVTVMARVQVSYLFRGFDRSDERRAMARKYAERAVQLAPQNPEALAALGIFHFNRGGDLAQARELLGRAIRLQPEEPFFHRFLNSVQFLDPTVPVAEALAGAEKTAALFPGDALVHYELARRYRDVGRIADMERALDRAIAITPLANAIMWKARIALSVRGDAAEMKALMDRVPARVRSLERVVFSRWIHAMATGRPEEGLTALQSLTSNWIEDFDFTGPKALLAAQLFEQQGKRELARLQYEAALTEVRARQARAPGDSLLRALEAWVMLGLGRGEEARALQRVTLETVRRPYVFAELSDWWFTAIPACLLLGDRLTALELLREAVTPPSRAAQRPTFASNGEDVEDGNRPAVARRALRLRFRLDPRMKPFREDPEIVALLTEPGK